MGERAVGRAASTKANIMLPRYVAFCFLIWCGDAFQRPTIPMHHHLGPLSSDTTTEAVLLPTKPKNSPYSAAQIFEAQASAEAQARIAFDAFAMNALFVNVDEQPEPMACAISVDSPTSQLPLDLSPGCLLRIGPNGASTNDGFLDGDGLVHAITIPPPGQQSNVMYSSTYVDTKGRKLERAAANGRTFLGTLGAAPEGLPMLANLFRNGITFGTMDVQKDTCNTALAVSGRRILALMEQAPPSEIKISKMGRMRTVESFARLDGAVPPAPINGGSFGAHGRTDPTTGERVHVSYQSTSRPYVRIDTFSDDWKLLSTVGVDVPSPVMVHDLALTPNYTIILDFPLTIRPRRMLLSNKFPVEYEPQNGARIGLTPRGRNGGETQWFDVENGVVLHAANAFEMDDGKVVIHAFKSFPTEKSSYILDFTPSFLYEWILDPTTGKTIKEHCINPNILVEFPICEISGQKASTVYGLVTTGIGGPLLQFKTPQSAVLLDSVAKFALEDDAVLGWQKGDLVDRFDLPARWHFVSEPTIANKTSSEGHYVLLLATFVPPADDSNKRDHVTVARDGKSMRTQLLILEGEAISNGPVTIVDLPHYVNYGLHSAFIDWSILE
ncbi:hypothetical protein ACHAWU_000717 [Discostella pseudostelligera]|uniref:Uncharacterized protein n=1 Tax=Discostella pseudostelligera TaxID=259834 RepID=A0ABD3M6P3_9STRA